MQKTNFNMKIGTLTLQVDISQPLTLNIQWIVRTTLN